MVRHLAALAVGLLGACSGSTTPLSSDVDPSASGTDETDEVTSITNEPEDPTQERPLFGPENAWWHAYADDVPADLVGTGTQRNDIAPDFVLYDQHAEQVQLYQFYGQVILLDLFAQWCEPCQDMAPEGQHIWETYQDDGFVYIAVMHESFTGAPKEKDLNDWADAFSLTHPVLADGQQQTGPYVLTGYPTFVLIDRDMTIVEPDMWPLNENQIANTVYAQ